MIKIILYSVVIYFVFVTILFVMQRRLLYFPSPARPAEPLVQTSGLAFWPTADEPYRGLISAGQEDEYQGTIIVFHGNAGRAVDRSYYVPALMPLGYRVLLAEYPGYGGRPGRPSEAALVADAKATVELAYQAFGPPIYLWGESLGCGVATALAADAELSIAGLILVTPWDSLPNLAQSIYWFFPARWLVLDQFDNMQQLQSFAGPVAVVLAGQDEVIPIRNGHRVYDTFNGPKKLWIFENAGHNNWPTYSEERWWREVMAFITQEARDAGR